MTWKKEKIIIKDRMVVISPSGWGQARLLSSEGIGFFFSRKIILNFTLNFDEKKI